MQYGYLIIFSSFYRAAYAQDILSEAGIRSTIKKAPTELSKSCAYALYIINVSAEKLAYVFQGYEINDMGVYAFQRNTSQFNSFEKYQKVK